ncbi:hypothetical protein SeMB42_g03192 [Synchytrium endobioticum]|uniref:Transmembrane protein 135 N-terminal domain-containing protein n=1 Tax=Synchytrium endobioticum TaxID=286115 RepID=A0A507D8H8_9FUNG|nr:hypothetical protein SeMB42_g03192 [Synchytrium endobioticum]
MAVQKGTSEITVNTSVNDQQPANDTNGGITKVLTPKSPGMPSSPFASTLVKSIRKPQPYKPSGSKSILELVVRAYGTGYAVAVLPSVVSATIKRWLLKRKSSLSIQDPLHIHVGGILVSSLQARLPWFLVFLVAGFRLSDMLLSWVAKRYIESHHNPTSSHVTPVEYPVTMQLSSSITSIHIGTSCSGTSLNSMSSICTNSVEATPLSPALPQPSVSPITLTTTFVAAAISAGAALCIVIPEHRRTDFALLAAVRALDSLMKYKRKTIQTTLRNHGVPDIAIENGDTLLFVLSCAEIMWAWFYHQYALPKSYVKWISTMSEIDSAIHIMLNRVRTGELVYRQYSPDVEICKEMARKLGLPESLGDTTSLGMLHCQVVHQGVDGCLNHMAKRWRCGFERAFRLYLPVHLIPVILFHSSRFTKPKEIPNTMWKILQGATQSSIFLASFIAMVWAPICFIRNYITKGRDREMFAVFMGCVFCGFSVLLEQKSRRREVALFCAPKAVEAAWRMYWPYRAMGYIVVGYMHLHGAVRGPIRALLQWFLGKPMHL